MLVQTEESKLNSVYLEIYGIKISKYIGHVLN